MTHHNKSGEELRLKLKALVINKKIRGVEMAVGFLSDATVDELIRIFNVHTTQAIQTALAAVREDGPKDYEIQPGRSRVGPDETQTNKTNAQWRETIDKHIKGAGK